MEWATSGAITDAGTETDRWTTSPEVDKTDMHGREEASSRRGPPLRIPIWQRIVFINVCGLVLFCTALLYFEDSRERYVALKGVELQLFGELLARDSIQCRTNAFRISCLIDLERARSLAMEFAREAGTRIRFVGQHGQPLADSLEISGTAEPRDTMRTEKRLVDWRASFSRAIDILQRWPNVENPSMAYTVPEHAGPARLANPVRQDVGGRGLPRPSDRPADKRSPIPVPGRSCEFRHFGGGAHQGLE